MHLNQDSLLQFMVRYSPCGVIPLAWFAYIGGISPWWGASAGFVLTFLVGLPPRLRKRVRQRARVPRRP